MLKKIVIGLAAAVVLGAAMPALALDFSAVKVQYSKNINQDCMLKDGYDPVWSCFINHFVKKEGSAALVPQPTVYLRSDIPAGLFAYAFFQSLGQYAVLSYSDQELATVFNPAPDQFGNQDVRRAAASSFAAWALGAQLTPAKLEFFRTALSR